MTAAAWAIGPVVNGRSVPARGFTQACRRLLIEAFVARAVLREGVELVEIELETEDVEGGVDVEVKPEILRIAGTRK